MESRKWNVCTPKEINHGRIVRFDGYKILFVLRKYNYLLVFAIFLSDFP